MEVEKDKLDHEIVELFFEEFEENDFDWNVSKGPVELDINMENLKSNKYKDFLFNDQLLKLDKLLQEFELGKNGENKGKTRTKNIGVIGDRGTGKTSYLKTIKNLLDSDSGYYTFDIVDPNILGSSISILEILVSLIYKEVNDYIDISNNYSLELQARIMRNLKDISTTLSNLRKKDAYFKENNPSIDVLEDITTRIEFNKRFNELLEDFKSFIDDTKNKQVKEFVLIIDDLDLIKNHEVYSMLNDIQNFLTGNLVLVIAYRDEQLVDSVLDQKIIENQRLLESNHFGEEELQKQSINMIDKLIPYNNRIYLEDDSAELSLYHLLQNLVLNESRLRENLKDLTVDDFFKEAILYKTNLPVVPIDSSEKTTYIFPKNLRGQLQLFELLVKEMASKPEDDDWVSFYKENLSIYKSYFYDKFTNILDMERQSSINNWLDKETRSRNGYMYKYIYHSIPNKIDLEQYLKDDYRLLEAVARMEDYNISLGDIFDILEVYKVFCCEKKEDYYYLYTIKMVYSIQLLEYLLSAIIAEESKDKFKKNIYREKYLSLINAKIMPREIRYFNKGFNVYYIREYENIFRKIHYTDLAKNSDIAKSIFNYKRKNWSDFNQDRYRQIFNYSYPGITMNNNKLVEGGEYPVDPFAFLAKDFYLDFFIKDHIDYKSINEEDEIENIKYELSLNYQILKNWEMNYYDKLKSLDSNIDYLKKQIKYEEERLKNIKEVDDENIQKNNNRIKYLKKELGKDYNKKIILTDKYLSIIEDLNNIKLRPELYLNKEISDEHNINGLSNLREKIYNFYNLDDLLIYEDNKVKGVKLDNYIFYSLFDIDIIKRISYSYDKNKLSIESINTLINKLNTFLSCESINPSQRIRIPFEVKLQKYIMKRSFKTGELISINVGYIRLFSEYEKRSIGNLLSNDYFNKKEKLEEKLKRYQSTNKTRIDNSAIRVNNSAIKNIEKFIDKRFSEKLKEQFIDFLILNTYNEVKSDINLENLENTLKDKGIKKDVILELKRLSFEGKTNFSRAELDIIEALSELDMDLAYKELVVDYIEDLNGRMEASKRIDSKLEDELAYLYSTIFLILAGQEDDL